MTNPALTLEFPSYIAAREYAATDTRYIALLEPVRYAVGKRYRCVLDRAFRAAPKPIVGERKMNGPVPGATRKLSITDRAVQLLIKGQTREQVIAALIEAGATRESARCTAHFVFTGKVSKAHAAMIANKKWVGASKR